MTRTIPQHVDSTGKLFTRLALVSKEKVYVNGKPLTADRDVGGKYVKYEIEPPRSVVLSPSILRVFSCTAGCTACCLPFTLDFTNDEFNFQGYAEDIDLQMIDQFRTRNLTVNGVTQPIQTYEQFRDPSCPYLRPSRKMTCPTCGGTNTIEVPHPSGYEEYGTIYAECPKCDHGQVAALGCGFYTENNSTQPLECAAAPQILMTTRGQGNTVIMKRPFGRGWAWKDKPQCHFDPLIDGIKSIPENFDLSNEISLLERYLHWAEYFSLDTHLPALIEALQDFPALLRKAELKSVVVFEA